MGLQTRHDGVSAGEERHGDARLRRAEAPSSADSGLVWAATFFVFAVLIHNADHVRRGADAVSSDVFWVGMAAIALEVAVVVMVFQRHRLVPLVTATAGFALAAGYLVVHFLPQRSWLSDSFTSAADVSPLSWIAASVEVLAAAALGAAGLALLRRRREATADAAPSDRPAPLGAALLHPAATAMVVGNALVVAISLVQL